MAKTVASTVARMVEKTVANTPKATANQVAKEGASWEKVNLAKANLEKAENGRTTGQDSTNRGKNIARTTICGGHAATTNARGPTNAPNKTMLATGYVIKITRHPNAHSSNERKLTQGTEYPLWTHTLLRERQRVNRSPYCRTQVC